MELYHGSPGNMTGREDKETRTYRLLDELGIEFDRTDHPEQPATTMEICARVDEDLLGEEWFGCHPCVNTSSIRLKTKDVMEVFLPAVRHGYTTVHLVGVE